MATDNPLKKDSPAYLEELLRKGDDKSIQEAVATLYKLCYGLLYNKKHPEGLGKNEVHELLLKPTPVLKKVQKLMKNESLVQAIVQLLHHPVLLREATSEESAQNQDFDALVYALGCLAFFPDFTSSLAAAGLPQEFANLTETFQEWVKPSILDSEPTGRYEEVISWIRRLRRFADCLDDVADMLSNKEFGNEAARVGLISGLLKVWPPRGFDHPRYFMIVQGNEVMCECANNMLRVVSTALKSIPFADFRATQRNELTEWLLALLTWQRLLGAHPESFESEHYKAATVHAWLVIYVCCLEAGKGVRSKLAKRMQKMCQELLASAEARAWSPQTRSTMEQVAKEIDEQMREREAPGGSSSGRNHPPENGESSLPSPRALVPPAKVASLLRSGKKADIARGVQAIRALLQGDMDPEEGTLRRRMAGLPYERAGVREALMDALEGPLGGWLVQSKRVAELDLVLAFLDSMHRRFLREAARAEAGDWSPGEFPPWEYWRAQETEEGGESAPGGMSRDVNFWQRMTRLKKLEEEWRAANQLEWFRRRRELRNGTSNGSLHEWNDDSEEQDGDSNGRNIVSDGRNGVSDGRNGDSDGRNEASDGQAEAHNGQLDESTGVSDGADDCPAMDPVVLRLLLWVQREPAPKPAIFGPALMPIEIELARVPSARLVAAQNGALALGKRIVEATYDLNSATRVLVHRAWGMLDALLREDLNRLGESAECRRLARQLGLADTAAAQLGAGLQGRSAELHLLNVFEACTMDNPERAWGRIRTRRGFVERAVERLQYALSVYFRAKAEGWDVDGLAPPGEVAPHPLGTPEDVRRDLLGLPRAQEPPPQQELLPAPGVRAADDLDLQWSVSETYLDPPPVWPRAFGAVFQLLTLLSDAVRYQGDAAFLEFVRSGGVEAAAGLLNSDPPRTMIVRSADPDIYKKDWGIKARSRLSDAVILAQKLWDKAEAKYGLRKCGRYKDFLRQCHQRESKGGTFKQCGRKCGVFYCSKACQVKHWKEGHKEACRPRNSATPSIEAAA